MLMKVYSPDGEMVEVPPHRAKHLTMNLGWTFSAVPVPLFKEEKKAELPKKAPEVAPVVRKPDVKG